jgi:hypothetical protein
MKAYNFVLFIRIKTMLRFQPKRQHAIDRSWTKKVSTEWYIQRLLHTEKKQEALPSLANQKQCRYNKCNQC